MSKADQIKTLAQGNWRIAMGRCEEGMRSVIAKSSDDFEDVEAVYELEDESALLILGEDNITSHASFQEAMEVWQAATAAKKEAVNKAYWGGPTPENVCPDCGLIHDDEYEDEEARLDHVFPDHNVRYSFNGPESGLLCEDGNIRVIVDHKGVLLSDVMWEMTNGPIPRGMLVKHVDGDLLNNKASNLKLVVA